MSAIGSDRTPRDGLARALLAAAAEVEAAEGRIREAIATAARKGDNAKVLAILGRWERLPAAEVLADSPELSCNSVGT